MYRVGASVYGAGTSGHSAATRHWYECALLVMTVKSLQVNLPFKQFTEQSAPSGQIMVASRHDDRDGQLMMQSSPGLHSRVLFLH